MRTWRRPPLPELAGRGIMPRVRDTARGAAHPLVHDGVARIYVCGITPYDATHLGHANTYLAFDTLVRALLDARVRVEYVQNTTDVDDPLLERAAERGVDWRDLAREQIELFRRDMQELGVIPPTDLVAVTERIEPIAAAVRRLLDDGVAYLVDDDVYFDIAAAQERSPWRLGEGSGLDRESMLRLSAERGGDPGRPGKRDALDPLLWRAVRPGEPSWPSPVGEGRPGWHIECSVIAQERPGTPLALNGGAEDLVFPHHEFSAAHTAALTGSPLSHAFVHAGLLAYQGTKMSKSLGNLVFVRALLDDGEDPRSIRLALLAHRYRESWEWTPADLDGARRRLAAWSRAAGSSGPDEGEASRMRLTEGLRRAIADDLDTPAAIALVDERVAAGEPLGQADRDAIDALLGVRLSG